MGFITGLIDEVVIPDVPHVLFHIYMGFISVVLLGKSLEKIRKQLPVFCHCKNVAVALPLSH